MSTDGYVPGEPITDSEIAGVLHMTGFAPEGLPFRVDVPKLEAPEDFSALQVPEVELALGGLTLSGAVDATFGEAPRISGELRSNTFDPRALLASVGIEAPKTTDPGALGKLQFSASAKSDAGTIAIEPLSLTLDDTTLKGHLRMTGSEKPSGEFALRGDSLDVARYVPPPDPDSEPFVLPTATLKSLQFRGVVELERATFNDVEMQGVVLRLVLDEQGLRTEKPTRVSAPETAP